MTQTRRPGADSTHSETVFPFWSNDWLSAFEDTEHRVQRFRQASQALQETMQDASVAQLEDMLSAMTRISTALRNASREDQPGALFSAQPEIVSCMVEMTQAGNQRLLDVAERMRVCTMHLAGANGPAAQPQPAETGQGDIPRKADAAMQNVAETTPDSTAPRIG